MTNFKTKRHEDKKWLLEQREQNCVFTGSETVEVAHLRKGAHSGVGMKPHDYFTLPIDYRLHREQHNTGEVSFLLKYTAEYPLVLMEIGLAFAQLRYLKWLVANRREKEAIKILGG